MLDKYYDSLIGAMLPDTQNMREAARCLSTRAMRHIGENRLKDAWSDLMAIHRLARLTSQSPTLVGQFVAMSLSNTACEGTLVLLGNKQVKAELARQIYSDLAGLSEFSGINNCLDNWERLSALDFVLYAKRYGLSALWDKPTNGPNVSKLMTIDWNASLRQVNRWYDRLVTTTRLPTREAKKLALAKFEADLSTEAVRAHEPVSLVSAFFSLERRSKMVGTIIASTMMSNLNSEVFAEDRFNTTLQMTRVATALAIYRAEHGDYPKKLGELTPKALEKLPVDVYNAKPFLYERLSEGYLLYCAGEAWMTAEVTKIGISSKANRSTCSRNSTH
jgi:hypothetical protein